MQKLVVKKIELVRRLRHKLEEGGYSTGTWMQLPCADIAEILSSGPFDWVAVDWEHGSFDIETLSGIFRAVEINDCLPFVRLPRADEAYCKWALDAGAVGLIIPMIRSVEEVRKAISWSAWPESGARGVGFSRANLYGADFDAYKTLASAPFIVPIIENTDALSSLRDIAQIPGVDALFVGPYDLSASLGCMGDFDNKSFVSAMESISTTCRDLNKPFGVHVVNADPKELLSVQKMSYRFNAYSMDTVMLGAQIRQLEKAKVMFAESQAD